MNRKRHIQSFVGYEDGVQYIRFNDTTGDIIRVWTINGDLYSTKSACPSSESILSCISHERKLQEWNSRNLIITDHRRSIVKFWLKQVEKDPSISQKKWSLV